jgi:lactate permease
VTLGVLAVLPILAILVLMVGRGWSAARAGAVGAALALIIAFVGFGFGRRPALETGAGNAVLGVAAEAVFTSLTILWIIFPALCIYHLQTSSGAIEVLRDALGRITRDPRIFLILIAWFFALFLEGAAGFGTPVALAAPFLVASGIDRVEAVVLVLVGHAVGVSFGAVGTPVLPQVAVTGFDPVQISGATGVYHVALGWLMLVFLLRIASRGRREVDRGTVAVWVWVFAGGLGFAIPFFAISRWLGPELPTLGGALIGGILFVLALRLFGGGVAAPAPPAAPESRMLARRLVQACAPYLVLVGAILLTRLVPPVRELTRSYELSWTLNGAFSGTVSPLHHPGTMLFVGFVAGAWLQRQGARAVAGALRQASGQLGPVALALVTMLFLSRLMVHSGMIDSMAVMAAGSVGPAWPFLVPFVGALGSFITGSATASNILFTDFQRATAETLEIPALAVVGGQGFGASVGNIISPHNIIAGSATVGLGGQEGAVLRATLPPCLIYAGLGGVLVWWFTMD